MIKKVHPILIIFLLILPCCRKSDGTKEMIYKARDKYTFVEKFLNTYSEKDLAVVMNFAYNPYNHFEEIKKIPRLFSYFAVMDRLGNTDSEYEGISWHDILEKIFSENKLSEKKLEILTFLLLNATGYFGEMMVDPYINLFSENSSFFIKFFSKRPEWKRIVYFLDAGDWETFKTAVEKLGDSGFEGEFKRFVLAPLDKEGKRIIK